MTTEQDIEAAPDDLTELLGPPAPWFKRKNYTVGPRIAATVGLKPFKDDWQKDATVLCCEHEWETVLLGPPAHDKVEEVVRCSKADCHAPRCGSADDPDPCMKLRHHTDPHHFLSGATRAVGAHSLP